MTGDPLKQKLFMIVGDTTVFQNLPKDNTEFWKNYQEATLAWRWGCMGTVKWCLSQMAGLAETQFQDAIYCTMKEEFDAQQK